MNAIVEQKQAESPALTRLAADYPLWMKGRVPKTVRTTEYVAPDWIVGVAFPEEYKNIQAFPGNEFPAWVNSHGAVAAIFPDGRRLGLKPGEFEVIEWHEAQTAKP